MVGRGGTRTGFWDGNVPFVTNSDDGFGYGFRSLSHYIHLNPARARLLGGEKPSLASYPWSSYRAFLSGKSLPRWFVRERVFDALGPFDLVLSDYGASVPAASGNVQHLFTGKGQG